MKISIFIVLWSLNVYSLVTIHGSDRYSLNHIKNYLIKNYLIPQELVYLEFTDKECKRVFKKNDIIELCLDKKSGLQTLNVETEMIETLRHFRRIY